MKQQQQWVKDLMFYLISSLANYNGDMNSEGYKYTIQAAIDNYSTIYWNEKGQKNINIYANYGRNFTRGYYKNVLLSEDAYEMLCLFKNRLINEEELKRKLHGEHLTPMAYTRDMLNKLMTKSFSDDEIREGIDYAFSDAKYCIITKDEQSILDKAGKRFKSKEIEQFLLKYKTIHTNLPVSKELDFLALEGKPMKSNGFGAIRLFVLQNNSEHKVIFVDDKGKTKSFKECIEYLEDNIYTI